MSIRGNMNIKQYEELINLYDSWWDSMPREMQIEIRKFYGEWKMSSEILHKVKEWLDLNIEEQDLSYELRQESARLRDKIEEWERE